MQSGRLHFIAQELAVDNFLEPVAEGGHLTMVENPRCGRPALSRSQLCVAVVKMSLDAAA